MGPIVATLLLATLAQGEAPRCAVRAVVAHRAVQPGQTIPLAVELTPAEGWHVYWKNPGDSGVAPSIEWTLPIGWTWRERAWPTPERFVSGALVNYGYSEPVGILGDLVVPEGARGEHRLSAKVAWMACKEYCVTGETTVEAVVRVGEAASARGIGAETISRFASRIPSPIEGASAAFSGKEYVLTFPADGAAAAYFFCEAEGTIDPTPAQKLTVDGGVAKLSLPMSEFAGKPAERLRGILQTSGAGGIVRRLVNLPVQIS